MAIKGIGTVIMNSYSDSTNEKFTSAVNEAIQRLESLGHQVIEIKYEVMRSYASDVYKLFAFIHY